MNGMPLRHEDEHAKAVRANAKKVKLADVTKL